jgi:Phage integrase, N-terminal SAM-like domain
VTFADAPAEWLRYVAEDRDVKPSTLTDYRSVVRSRLLPEFDEPAIEELSAQRIEPWRAAWARAGRSRTERATRR